MGLGWCCTKSQRVHHENSSQGHQRFLSIDRSIQKCGKYYSIFRKEEIRRTFP